MSDENVLVLGVFGQSPGGVIARLARRLYAEPSQEEGSVPQTINFSGRWRNQRGSEMNLTVAADGSVTGTYHSDVGGPITSPIAGKVNGDQIVFFVDWMPGSMTIWAGQLLTAPSGNEVLETAWLNTRDVSQKDEPHSGWAGLRTGGDQFTRLG